MTPPSTTPELQLELPVRPESVTAARHAVGEIGFQLGCDAVAVRIAVRVPQSFVDAFQEAVVRDSYDQVTDILGTGHHVAGVVAELSA